MSCSDRLLSLRRAEPTLLTAASVGTHRSGPLGLRGELIKVLHHKTLLPTAAPFPEEVPLGKSGGAFPLTAYIPFPVH